MTKPISVKPGERVTFLGPRIDRPSDGSRLERGSLGTVVYVVAPDDEDDGYAAVAWSGWPGRRLIRPESENIRWKR